MLDKLRHGLRVVAFALGFSAFGALSLLLACVAFPLLRLTTAAREERELRAQHMVQSTFRIFLRILRVLDVAELNVIGGERLHAPGAHLLVANHPTLIDVVVIGSLMPQLDCVAKRAAWSNPFMLGVVRGTGYLANDDGVALIEAGSQRLARGRSLLLFPEGTRSPRGGLHPFQRGAAHLALQTGLPILPVHIRCEPPGLAKGQKWWDVPPRRMHFTLEICEPMHVQDLVEPGDRRSRAARRITAALRDFYAKRLHSAL